MMIVDNDLISIQEARILAENAGRAQRVLATFSQEQLDEIVEAVAEAVGAQAQALADMAYEETDYGNPHDKAVKNRFVCTQVREQLRGMRCVGVIGRDEHARTMDIGVPVGVIAALCPATSPVSTTICKTLIAVKSGNAVVFSPHPRAARSIAAALDIMIDAARAHGLPEGCLSYMSTVTKSGTAELMNHPATSLVMLSGVPGMIGLARCSGKPVIYGGTGNGPAFVERSADIRRAVADIMLSKTFDNGIAPSAEQSIVVDSCIEREVRHALQECGAYFMTDEESLRLAELLFCADGRHKAGMVGVSAPVLARRAGISVPDNVQLLVAERKYVSEADPYSRELLSPVLAYYVEDDWMHACEKCIELLLHERNAHTLVIHSSNEEVILQFALKKPVGRLLVNTPATFGGMGVTTNLFPSMTLGSGSAGRGITADNVSPMNLIYIRKVGYGVRQYTGAQDAAGYGSRVCAAQGVMAPHDSDSRKMQALHRILMEAIGVMDGAAHR
ncbi:aldehyde dehydrogenase family protein [Oleidesulfovibrio alaskensis]|uniref:aldehyde dehydrogenase family protein n=1 Tax=Oleidesulfovibrio alaskensis TaxID=58180 RepID=UPI0003F4B9D1|nr:aldehyde dehydrogenase family protein [Oleidesulfovibrio alaskensis]